MLQSNPLVLVFAVIALFKLRESVESVLLDVFLPVLLLVPAIYTFRVPHLPPIECIDAVLLPLGFATLISRFRNHRFQRTDLWVLGFALAGFYTDLINLDLTTALYNFPSTFLQGVFAYYVGKMLIEQQGLREKFIKRMAVLLAVVGVISVAEFLGRHDLFVAATSRFFGTVNYWEDQYRYGFLRVKGPFQGPEEAGIVFLIGFFLALWLWYSNKTRHVDQQRRFLGLTSSGLCIAGILLGLVMTLSRGPLLGAAMGYLIARIAFVNRKQLAMGIAVVLITVGAVAVQVRAAQYAHEDNDTLALGDSATDESRSSAAYRTQLYEVYKPVAQKGGAFGWSATGYRRSFAEFPKAASFFSIDNEYLLLWVIQGKIGLALFLLIAAEGLLALVLAILRSPDPIDTCFYYCLTGMLGGLLLVLSTVFLAGQGYLLFFLCSGWIQSLPDVTFKRRAGAKFAFRRVLAS